MYVHVVIICTSTDMSVYPQLKRAPHSTVRDDVLGKARPYTPVVLDYTVRISAINVDYVCTNLL